MTKTRVNHRHVSINLCIKTRTRLEVLGRLRIPSRYGYVVRSNVIGDCVTRVEVLSGTASVLGSNLPGRVV